MKRTIEIRLPRPDETPPAVSITGRWLIVGDRWVALPRKGDNSSWALQQILTGVFGPRVAA
jgi:hypothetical protein